MTLTNFTCFQGKGHTAQKGLVSGIYPPHFCLKAKKTATEIDVFYLANLR